MLGKLVMHEPEDGSQTYTIGPEVEDDPCAVCGGESVERFCRACGKYHHHGRVHSLASGELVALCQRCSTEDAAT